MATYKDAMQKYIKSAQARKGQRSNAIASMLMTTSNPVGSPANTDGAASYNPAAQSGSHTGTFQSFLKSIAKQESGGNYNAVNKSSGALGKYQIMPGNISSTQQFLRSPKIQEQVAQHKLLYYFNKYGATGAAKAWYGGEGAARRSSSRKQGAYPSINAYANKVTSRVK